MPSRSSTGRGRPEAGIGGRTLRFPCAYADDALIDTARSGIRPSSPRATRTPMQRMSPLDASFLHMEDGVTHMHIGSCAIFEGPAPAYDELLRADRRQAAAPPALPPEGALRPAGASAAPSGSTTPTSTSTYHVRHTALPPPGRRGGAAHTSMGRLMSQELDRHRPLWEIWMVEGLPGRSVGDHLEDPPLHGRRGLGHRPDGAPPRPRPASRRRPPADQWRPGPSHPTPRSSSTRSASWPPTPTSSSGRVRAATRARAGRRLHRRDVPGRWPSPQRAPG